MRYITKKNSKLAASIIDMFVKKPSCYKWKKNYVHMIQNINLVFVGLFVFLRENFNKCNPSINCIVIP